MLNYSLNELFHKFSHLQSIMTAFWRAAGLTYVSYSSIAARVTRQALKKPLQVRICLNIFWICFGNWICFETISSQDLAAKRDITSIKFQKWEAGKPVGAKY